MKRTIVLALAVFLMASLMAGSAFAEPAHALTQAGQGQVMTKVVKNFKAGHYKKAAKLAKKLPTYASEPCVKKMTKRMKAAYRKVVKSYKLDPVSIDATPPQKGWLQDYFLTDVNNDRKADLIIKTGSCEADYFFTAYIYSAKKNKAVKYGRVSAGHAVLLAYPKHRGVVLARMHQGYASYCLAFTKKGNRVRDLGGVADADLNDYFWARDMLKSHVSYENGSMKLAVGQLN